MNKDIIEKRIQELKTKQQQINTQATELKAQYEHAIQQLNLLEGAIADCVFWQQEFEKEAKPAE